MHFLVLGATGRTGLHVVSELLLQGHTVVALVRAPDKLSPRPGLTVVAGSPLSPSDLCNVVSPAPDATIVTLNTLRASDSPFAAQISPPRFLADSCAKACEALESAGARRIVVMSTAGVGDSWETLPWMSKAFMRWTNVTYALDDHGLVDGEIRSTDMDWTLVRAVRLEFSSKPAKEVEALGSKGQGMRVSDSVNVANVARFLVKVAVEGLYVRDAVVVRD